MKNIQYLIEAFFVWLLFKLFQLLPVDVSSAIGAGLARLVGPFMSAHKTARRNIEFVFPEMKSDEVDTLLGRMWGNLGRIGAEYPLLQGTRLTRRVHVHGKEFLPPVGKPALFFSGHMGNWELTYPAIHESGIHTSLIYRHINNPYIDTIIAGFRRKHSDNVIAKGAKGAVKILTAIKRGGIIAMLLDQKLNTGMAIPFFGRDAMTATAIADIALKYDIPIIPMRVVRRKGAHFDEFFYPALSYQRTGDHAQDVREVLCRINETLEGWIREHPEQWFWVHRRWPK